MQLEKLKRQLIGLENKLKIAKCNRCAEKILRKAQAIKDQIKCLEAKQ